MRVPAESVKFPTAMTNTLFEDVTDTASWVAAYRARESARADALFHDPFAGRLTDERGRRIADEIVGAKNFAWMMAVRTCVLDELIVSAVGAGVDTVLNLGAGMDTRPYRLPLPAALRWIEVDHERVLERKEARLNGEAPVCSLRRVRMDLAQVPERRRLFAELDESASRTLVVAEGVIGYLTNEDVGALARDLASCAHFTQWIVDYSSPILRKAMRRRRKVRKQFQAAPLLFDPPDWEGFFREHDWTIRTMHFLGEEGERRGRPMPLPWWMHLLTRLAPGQRAQARRMLGFAVLNHGET